MLGRTILVLGAISLFACADDDQAPRVLDVLHWDGTTNELDAGSAAAAIMDAAPSIDLARRATEAGSPPHSDAAHGGQP